MSDERPVSTLAAPGRHRPVPEIDTDPPYTYPDYLATRRRAPQMSLLPGPGGLAELGGPVFGRDRVAPGDADLTAQHEGTPLGQRIIVAGRVLDSDGRPVRGGLVEVWQANSAGRYRHPGDDHPAPLDPNFSGFGRALTDGDGNYRFTTVRPGAYPWRNHANAWRPAHIHFSLFGIELRQRLVTQMYFENDPLFFQDPIFNSVPADARQLLICRLDIENTIPDVALAYRFDIVLRGARQTPFEDEDAD